MRMKAHKPHAMVSTRGVKFNFTDGERVLCYEPDPNKAKVLYDSKILSCCIGKDANGRKCPEYLVHFYGWNSSWDRCVAEENIVKDSPENRQLQRKLAERAAYALKGKKLKLNKIPAIIKEIVINSNAAIESNDDTPAEDNECDNEREDDDDDEEEDGDDGDDGDGDFDDIDDDALSCNQIPNVSGSVSGDTTVSEMANTDDTELQSHTYNLSTHLRQILDNDYIYIVANKHSYQLPLNPNVSEIIANFDLHDRFVANAPNDSNQLLDEFKCSMETYFNALTENSYLFYNDIEKQQYVQYTLINYDTPPVKTYGLVHLLRMMVTMPEFLTNTSGITKKQLKIILKLIQNFADYLNNNKEKFYTQ